MRKRIIISSSSANSGFTLLEGLIVVVLLSILAGIAAPGWLGYLSRQRASRASNDLIRVLEQAQADARQQNASRVVRISSASPPQVEVLSAPGAATGVIKEIGDQNASLTLTSGPDDAIEFDRRGTVDSDDIPFIFSVNSDTVGAGQVRCVIVGSLLGNMIRANGADCDPTRYEDENSGV